MNAETLPMDALATFVQIERSAGSAKVAAQSLNVSQPTVSKRLTLLRRAAESSGTKPWLVLQGKRWQLTPAGRRIYPVMADLVQRHDAAQKIARGATIARPRVAIACGQHAGATFVGDGVAKLLRRHPDVSVTLSTPRGSDRITGVVAGIFDFALVTNDLLSIRKHAGMELFVEDLRQETFVIYGAPGDTSWASKWNALPKRRPVRAAEIVGLPFVLPEKDSSLRQQFEEWMYDATEQVLDAVVEAGGWRVLSRFAATGVGVGIFPRSVLSDHQLASARKLSPEDFPPKNLRLIARKLHGENQPDLSPLSGELRRMLISIASKS